MRRRHMARPHQYDDGATEQDKAMRYGRMVLFIMLVVSLFAVVTVLYAIIVKAFQVPVYADIHIDNMTVIVPENSTDTQKVEENVFLGDDVGMINCVFEPLSAQPARGESAYIKQTMELLYLPEANEICFAPEPVCNTVVGDDSINSEQAIDPVLPPEPLFPPEPIFQPEQETPVTEEKPYIYEATDEERLALEKLVYVEARGESYEGQIAVAAVALNRLNSQESFFKKDSILTIIQQKGQFAKIGWVTKAMLDEYPTCREAVDEALRGEDPTKAYFEGGALYFFDPRYVKGYERTIREGLDTYRIGDHLFHVNFDKVM